MNDFRQKLDKFIEDLLKTTSRSTLVQVTAIYLLIRAFFGFCGGLALVGLGGLAGATGVLGTAAGEGEAVGLGFLGVILFVIGVVYVVLAPVSLVVAIGLFQRKAWSRMGTVILATIGAVVSFLWLLSGGGVSELLWVIASAFVAYVFYTDAGIKQELGG